MKDHADILPDGLDMEMLSDLQRQSREQITKLRKHARWEISAPVKLRPGNFSASEACHIEGTSVDFSSGGCMANFPVPVPVGDVFRMELDNKELDLPLVFMRCLRCRLVREDVYEAGFSFFNPIALPDQNTDDSGQLL